VQRLSLALSSPKKGIPGNSGGGGVTPYSPRMLSQYLFPEVPATCSTRACDSLFTVLAFSSCLRNIHHIRNVLFVCKPAKIHHECITYKVHQFEHVLHRVTRISCHRHGRHAMYRMCRIAIFILCFTFQGMFKGTSAKLRLYWA